MSGPLPWEPTISVGVLLELYGSRMEKYGGDQSGPKPGCLEGCLGNAWTAETYHLGDEGEDSLRPGLIFAAYLLFYLTNDHCFADGNKRLGWSAMAYVFGCHSVTIDAAEDEAYAFMLAVASHKMTQDEVVVWLADRLATLQ